MLTDNRDVLDAIAKMLIEEEKIDGKQLLQLIKNVRPGLVTDKALEAVDKIITPTSPAPQEAA